MKNGKDYGCKLCLDPYTTFLYEGTQAILRLKIERYKRMRFWGSILFPIAGGLNFCLFLSWNDQLSLPTIFNFIHRLEWIDLMGVMMTGAVFTLAGALLGVYAHFGIRETKKQVIGFNAWWLFEDHPVHGLVMHTHREPPTESIDGLPASSDFNGRHVYRPLAVECIYAYDGRVHLKIWRREDANEDVNKGYTWKDIPLAQSAHKSDGLWSGVMSSPTGITFRNNRGSFLWEPLQELWPIESTPEFLGNFDSIATFMQKIHASGNPVAKPWAKHHLLVWGLTVIQKNLKDKQGSHISVGRLKRLIAALLSYNESPSPVEGFTRERRSELLEIMNPVTPHKKQKAQAGSA